MFNSGIGGGGFMLIHKGSAEGAQSSYEFVDFRETAPAAATEEMFEGNVEASIFGGLASAVPGQLRGLEYLHQNYGRLPWATVVEPAVNVAQHGFTVNEDLVDFFKTTYTSSSDESYLVTDPAWAVDFAPEGRLLGLGERMTRKRLAGLLQAVASRGADAFYERPMAEAMVNALKQRGGIMTLEDVKGYTIVKRETSQIDYRGGKIVSGSAPSSGAITLSAMKILQGYDFIGDLSRANETAHLINEAMKFSYGMRTKLGDPSFVDGMTAYQEQVLSDEMAASIRSKITDKPLKLADYNPEGIESLDTPGTSHMVAMDSSGLAISLTTTLNLMSHLMVPETGIVMNSDMNDFSIPGSSNAFGYIPSRANFIRPGKRPLSSMSPTMVERPDGSISLVTGSAGGSRIISATLQVLLNVLEKKMSLDKALAEPRLHDQLVPQEVTFEYPFKNSTVRYLEGIGNNVTWVAPGLSTPQALRQLPNGTFEAAGEPRQSNSAGYAT